jgi:uncharacterized protein
MATDHIRYDLLVREALRTVVRNVLSDVAKTGLPGEHHFYISFDSTAEGVRLSPRLRAQHPEEMTIVLQHQFWDLTVSETGFEVGLSFGGVPERLVVPFQAMKGFFDPSVQFGLEFEVAAESSESAESKAGATEGPQAEANREPASKGRKSKLPAKAGPALVRDGGKDVQPNEPVKQDGMAEVVSLDQFRKK